MPDAAALTASDIHRLVAEQIPFARHLGLSLEEASPSQVRVLLPASDGLRNHVGGLHAAALYAAAETAALSLAYLLLPTTGVSCTSKAVELRFRKPARGDVWAHAQLGSGTDVGAAALLARLTAEGKLDVAVLVAIVDSSGERLAEGALTVNLRRL